MYQEDMPGFPETNICEPADIDEISCSDCGNGGCLIPEMQKAVHMGNNQQIRALAAKHPGLINLPFNNFQTTIHHAARHGQTDVIQTLIDLGANFHRTSCLEGFTPLQCAAKYAQLGSMSTLLAHMSRRAEIDHKDMFGSTALMYACFGCDGVFRKEHQQAVELLLQASADVNHYGPLGFQPIHYAARRGNRAVISRLLAAGASPNGSSRHFFTNRTPLHQAAKYNNYAVIPVLLDAGANPEGIINPLAEPTRISVPPLCTATIRGHNQAVATLADGGADLHWPAPFKKLFLAIRREQPDFAEKEVRYYDNPEFDTAMTPLKFSVLTEKTTLVTTLLQKSQHSLGEISNLKHLAQTHKLINSLTALNRCHDFIPPTSLKVLSGRLVKKLLVENNSNLEIDSSIAKLAISRDLGHFLRWTL